MGLGLLVAIDGDLLEQNLVEELLDVVGRHRIDRAFPRGNHDRRLPNNAIVFRRPKDDGVFYGVKGRGQ